MADETKVLQIPGKLLAKANWTENDKESGGYIYNRPFGEIAAGAVIADETVVIADSGLGDVGGGIGIGALSAINARDFAAGASYTIIFDGDEYTAICEEFDSKLSLVAYDDNGGIIVGVEDSGFAACSLGKYPAGEHTLKIVLAADAVKTLNKRYLPKDITALVEKVATLEETVKTLSDGVEGVVEAIDTINGEVI